MAKSRFNIKGTKDFLVAAVFCGFLCLWSIRDAWFPTKKVLEKHPQEIEVSFEIPGVIKEILIKPGHEIEGRMLLATLYDDTHQARFAAAQAAFDAARKAKSDDLGKMLEELDAARKELDACTLENTDISWTSSHGEESLKGTVRRIVAEPATHVDAGDPVLVVNPKDTFYVFNKTLAILSFLGMILFLIFHWIASH